MFRLASPDVVPPEWHSARQDGCSSMPQDGCSSMPFQSHQKTTVAATQLRPTLSASDSVSQTPLVQHQVHCLTWAAIVIASVNRVQQQCHSVPPRWSGLETHCARLTQRASAPLQACLAGAGPSSWICPRGCCNPCTDSQRHAGLAQLAAAQAVLWALAAIAARSSTYRCSAPGGCCHHAVLCGTGCDCVLVPQLNTTTTAADNCSPTNAGPLTWGDIYIHWWSSYTQ